MASRSARKALSVAVDWEEPLRTLNGAVLKRKQATTVVEALVGHQSEFKRTPKYKVEGQSDTTWKQKRYRGTINWVPFVELGLAPSTTSVRWQAFRVGAAIIAGFIFGIFLGMLRDLRRLVAARLAART